MPLSSTEHGGAEEQGGRVISTRTIVLGLIIGIPLSVLFLWLAIRGVQLDEVWDAIQRARLGLVLLAVPFAYSLYVFQGMRWRHLVEAPEPLPTRRAFVALVLVGGAVTNVVPGRPGDIVRGVWLGRLGSIPMARSLTSVGVDRAVDVITVFVIILACLPFVETPGWLVTLVLVGGVMVLLAALVAVGAWWYAERSTRGRARTSLDPAERSWLGRQVSGVIRGLAVLSRPGDVALAFAWSLTGWLLNVCAGWLIATSLGLGLNLPSIAFVVGVLALGSAIPSSPGMIGTYQWLAVASMAAVGVGAAEALAFSVLSQAAWYLPLTLSGPPAAWWLSRATRTTVGAKAAQAG